MNLFRHSFLSVFPRHLVGIALLGGGLLFFHFGWVVPLEDELEAKEASWRSERPKIGELTHLKTVQEDLIRFWDGLPDETSLPRMVSFISESAGAHRLAIPAISYQPDQVEIPGMVKVVISFNVKGQYRQIRELIHRLERSRYFLVIENMVLASSAKEGEMIQLQLRIAAYLRKPEGNGSAGTAPKPDADRRKKTEAGLESPLIR